MGMSQPSQPGPVQTREIAKTGAGARRPPVVQWLPLTYWLQSATIVLIGLNVLMYLIMVVRGVSAVSPNAESVLKWGADYGPLTLHGQWWRMIVSMFLHFGIIHLGFNMLVLFSIGLFMEGLAGRLRFVVLYLVCGLGGSAASLAWHPSIVSAGASGAIFGLYGALLGFLLRHQGSIAPEALAAQRKWALTFIGYNLLFGLRPGVDMAAHLGGLATGFLLGLFLIEPPLSSNELRPASNWRVPAAVALGLALIVVPVTALPKPDDYLAEYRRLGEVEEKAIDVYNSSLKQWKAGQISDQQYADILEDKILPPWRAERQAMEKLKVSPDQVARHKLLVEYVNAREQGWELTAEGLVDHDADKLKQGAEKKAEAERIAGQLRR
jgi:rhomboid protease GluP